MNIKLRDRWIKALRSDDHTQGEGILNTSNNQCCLGVLCIVAGEPSKIDPDTGCHIYDGNQSTLTSKLIQKHGLTYTICSELMSMNDGTSNKYMGSLSFDQIATWIEENL